MSTAFIATTEANAVDAHKRMVTISSAEDIVYSNLFTGVRGNYLKPSIVAAGIDPEIFRNRIPGHRFRFYAGGVGHPDGFGTFGLRAGDQKTIN
jgi:NAD(P)H-dependent flavin oxidoreductase YrpB (nitropropane dioxygenase family)